jgi:molecular chaperone GrpE
MNEKNTSSVQEQQNNESPKALEDCLNKIKELEEKIKLLEEEKEKYLGDFKRARADLINYKQEEQERFKELMKFANERIVKELIGILDSFDLALQSLESMSQPTKDSYLKGIYLIKEQLEDLLSKEGLEEIKVELGKEPNLKEQEIVAEIENDNYSEGTVAAVFQKGYKFYDKLIRPVRVAVVKTKGKEN